MTGRSFEILLSKRNDQLWESDALALPKVRLLSVADVGGRSLPYTLKDDATVSTNSRASSLVGRVELPEDLVAQSVLDQAKIDLDRQRLEVEERGARRTLLVGLATALVSAVATIVVAAISHIGATAPVAPKAYQDLVECRESLNVLVTLSQSAQQTLPNLREAISRSVESCRERLNTAIVASPH